MTGTGPLPRGGDDRFADIPLWLGTQRDAVATVLADAGARRATPFRLMNAYSLYCAVRDPRYAELLRRRGVNLIDGKPLAVIMRRRHRDLPVQQVRGPTLFEACLDAGRASGVRHFLLGGSEELLRSLERALLDRYPGLVVAGTCSPPFRPLTPADRSEVSARIAATRPDIVWVGLGTPRQDIEGDHIARALAVTTVAVGAAFDFSAGVKAEAPAFLRSLGLEWLFRLASEPVRLWRRYLVGNTWFLRQAGREAVTRRRQKGRAAGDASVTRRQGLAYPGQRPVGAQHRRPSEVQKPRGGRR